MNKIKTIQAVEDQSLDSGLKLKNDRLESTFGPRFEFRRFGKGLSYQQTTDDMVEQKLSLQQKFIESGNNSQTSFDTNLTPQSLGPSLKRTVPLQGQQTIRSERKLLRQNGNQLKQIITEQKIKQLVRHFVKKISQNNIYSKAIDYTPFFNQKQLGFMDMQGIDLNEYILVFMSVCSTLLIVGLTILYTLGIVFKQVDDSTILNILQCVSLVFYLIELGLNLITVKFQEGKRLGTLKTIFSYCVRNTLSTDLISIIIIVIDLLTDIDGMNYIRLFIMVKLGHALEKLQKLEILLIHNFYYEQYWSLLKVFIFNFSLAHFLAILLIAMAGLNSDNNWMDYKDIILAPWPEKYAWAYYWATNIMLTVGFGDLAATNYKEAVVLTMIEMISCITLAYNINCVGTLISNIRQQDLEKGKNFKIFYKLSRKNDIPQDLEWRINNYIEESSNIKKKFNYEEENYFVEKLPNGLKTEFLKESHKKIFQNLPFFKHLMQKTLFNFAQRIQMHICHPEEIIQHIDEPHHLLILKGGEIGFTCKKNGCDYNNTVVDQVKVSDGQEPLLISLGFIRQPRSIYEVKSLEYSILYFLNIDNILQILKESEMDYELYCLLRDKASISSNEFELFTCEICKDMHTKFTCPKLHYTPFKQQVASKYIFQLKTGYCSGQKFFIRYNAKSYCPLKIYKDYNLFDNETQEEIALESQKDTQVLNMLSKRSLYEKIEDQTENVIIKEISDIKDFFSKNTAELIKNQVNKAFQEGEDRDEVWIINSDRVRNYKSYFECDNSCNLRNKFLPKRRSGTLITKTAPMIPKIPRKITNKISNQQLPYNLNEGKCKSSIMSLKELLSFPPKQASSSNNWSIFERIED